MAQINAFVEGGNGNLVTTRSGSVVTVEGIVNGATNRLDLNITPGVKVVWTATFKGNGQNAILTVAGGGEPCMSGWCFTFKKTRTCNTFAE